MALLFLFSQGDMAEYGVHPYYVVVDPVSGTSHSVLFFNSNAQGERIIHVKEAGEGAVVTMGIGIELGKKQGNPFYMG